MHIIKIMGGGATKTSLLSIQFARLSTYVFAYCPNKCTHVLKKPNPRFSHATPPLHGGIRSVRHKLLKLLAKDMQYMHAVC